MTAPDRPTREQVDAALRRAEQRYLNDERTLAAEVRALRAELEQADHFGRGEFRVTTWAYEQALRVMREAKDEVVALAARTPQSAESVEGASPGPLFPPRPRDTCRCDPEAIKRSSMSLKVIYRYRLPITDRPTLDLPEGAEVLSVGPPRDERDELDLWALLDPRNNSMMGRRDFRIVGTGNPVPADIGVFIGSVTTNGGSLVWHVFEAAPR